MNSAIDLAWLRSELRASEAKTQSLREQLHQLEEEARNAPAPIPVAAPPSPAPLDPNELLTVKQVARMLCCAPSTIYGLPTDVLPRAKHPTSLVRFRREDVERYRSEHFSADADVLDLAKVGT